MKYSNNCKTPLGYYEKAIAETVKIREEFQAELQVLRELQAAHQMLKAELQVTQQGIQSLETELQVTKVELQTSQKQIQILEAALQATKAELQVTNEHLEEQLSQTGKIAVAADIEAKAAQNIANTACFKIEAVKSGIENGSIVAQKALMLRARDDNHWMRFKYVKEAKNVEYDTFLVWKGDNTWQHTVRVGAADKLRQ